ncbi:DUF4097 family beta strand repeat-containing protein [Actinomadura miaoliensis]|uniref:DUF4097 family beta strand repeat-containing protein n=1 Tax=Actinomadura miaoliensis TaxID=430685 RepID=A0ABP7WZ45_9ACTN
MNTLTTVALATGAAAAAALALTGCSVDFGTHRETRAYDVRDAVTTVKLSSSNGRVEIVGSDSPGVHVQERLRWSNSRNKPAPRHSVAGGTLTLGASCGHTVLGPSSCQITYRLRVPRGLAVQVTTDNGAIETTGLGGRLTLRTDTGSITARDLRAPALSARTEDGSIRISGRADTADLTTDTGGISATALRSGRLTARTADGSIRLTGHADTADLTTDTGRIDAAELRSRRLDARTADGGMRITLTAPPDSVRARTDTGPIRLILPAEQSYAITMDSDNGARRIEPGVHNDNRSSRRVNLRTNDGSITVAAA